MRVLLIDDQEDVRELVQRALERDGCTVETAATMDGARTAHAARRADVIVLDVALPDGSGLDLCRELRRAGDATPIMLLTAHGDVAKRIEGLDAGADDFLPKPFAVGELRARVRALGRRGPLVRGSTFRRGDIVLDFSARRATVETRPVPLTPREWSVLELLAASVGHVVSRTDILEKVWGEANEQTRASLDVIVARIRRKLGEQAVRTVRHEGYTLDAS